MPKFLKIILYPVFFFVLFIVFSVFLFPFDSVKNRLASELENAMGGTYQITIGKLSYAPLGGAVLRDVELKPRPGVAGSPIKLQKATLKFAIAPLLSGSTEVDFDLKPLQGGVKGSFVNRRGGMAVNLNMDRFDLSLISFLLKSSGMSVSGMVSGKVDLELFEQDPLRNTGNINLDVMDLALGEMSFANGDFKVPAIRLAQGAGSKIDVQINRGNYEVKTVLLTGGDVKMDSNGKIYGARQAENYRFNLKGNFSIAPELVEKFPILGLVDKQKQADGTYPFTVTGRLTKPSIRIGEFKLPI